MRYIIVNLIVLVAFVGLSSYAYGMVYGHFHRPAQEVRLWVRDKAAEFHARQAAVLGAVYGVTAENLNQDIFGGDK